MRGSSETVGLSEPELRSLNLPLAWRRVKADQPKVAPVQRDLAVELVDEDPEEWLAALRGRLASGWRAGPAKICAKPRKSGLLRPFVVVSLLDEVVFAALVTAVAPTLRRTLHEQQTHVDLHALTDAPGEEGWSRMWVVPNDPAAGRRDLPVPADAKYVVLADIASFFDRVAIDPIVRRLEEIGCAPGIVRGIGAALRAWSPSGLLGVPTGCSGSFVLSRLSLEPVDRGLHGAGIRHTHAVDEYCLHCRDREEARRALTVLWHLLHQQGLTLNVSKVAVLPADDRRVHMGNEANLRRIARRLAMHWRLAKLERSGGNRAVARLADAFRSWPRDVSLLRKYLERGRLSPDAACRVLEALGRDEPTFGYPTYLALKTLRTRGLVTDGVLALARAWVADPERMPWIREECALLLAAGGEPGDAKLLAQAFPTCPFDATRAVVAYAGHRLGGEDVDGFEPEPGEILVARARDRGARERRGARKAASG